MNAPGEGRLTSWIEGCGCPGFGPKGQQLVKRRPWFMAVVISVNLGVMAYAGYPRERLAVLLGIIVLPMVFAIASVFHPRTRRLSPVALWLWLIAGSLFITSALATTGGLRSPLLPLLVVPIITSVAMWRWTLPARMIATTFTTSAFVLFLLPAAITGPTVPSPFFEGMLLFNLLAAVAFGSHTVLALSEGFTLQNRTLESMREQALENAARRVRSLEQVGAKVAHELKNPLAAIKSLLQLEQCGRQRRAIAQAAGGDDPRGGAHGGHPARLPGLLPAAGGSARGRGGSGHGGRQRRGPAGRPGRLHRRAPGAQGRQRDAGRRRAAAGGGGAEPGGQRAGGHAPRAAASRWRSTRWARAGCCACATPARA